MLENEVLSHFETHSAPQYRLKQTIISKYCSTQVWLECLRLINTFNGLESTIVQIRELKINWYI